jgi:hypothetical protein
MTPNTQITLFVRNLQGHVYQILIKNYVSCTMDNFYELVKKEMMKTQPDINNIKLIFSGKLLEKSDKLIHEYHFEKENCIHVIVKKNITELEI